MQGLKRQTMKQAHKGLPWCPSHTRPRHSSPQLSKQRHHPRNALTLLNFSHAESDAPIRK